MRAEKHLRSSSWIRSRPRSPNAVGADGAGDRAEESDEEGRGMRRWRDAPDLTFLLCVMAPIFLDGPYIFLVLLSCVLCSLVLRPLAL